MALDLGLNLQTHTPVTSVESGSSGQWKVITANREVNTRKVIHATNGYSSYLLPELIGRIVPLLGHVAAIPPSHEYQSKPLDKTMVFIWDSEYDYLIQRQTKGRHIILGGRDLGHREGLIGLFGESDDSVMSHDIVTALKDFPEAQFEGWSRPAKENVQEQANASQTPAETQVWSGVMGVSKDGLPFLGELPGKEGQYIAAGYSGHGKQDSTPQRLSITGNQLGMARIFLSVKAFCEFLCGEDIDSRVPSKYFDIKSRLKGEIDLAIWK